METQANEILRYIKQNGSITPMEAFTNLGITKLSTRIGELIKAGFNIKKEWTEHTNLAGRTSHFMRYSLVEDENNNI